MRLPDGTVRKLRRSAEGAGCAHELTFSCYRRLPLLASEPSRGFLIEALSTARKKYDFELWAYVLMPDHVHILLLPRDPNYRIRTLLQGIKQPVARRTIDFLKSARPDLLGDLRVPDANSADAPRFQFWQPGGGYDRHVVNARTAWRIVAYIHNNPVNRGLAACPTDWAWSSARQYAGWGGVLLEMDGRPPDE